MEQLETELTHRITIEGYSFSWIIFLQKKSLPMLTFCTYPASKEKDEWSQSLRAVRRVPSQNIKFPAIFWQLSCHFGPPEWLYGSNKFWRRKDDRRLTKNCSKLERGILQKLRKGECTLCKNRIILSNQFKHGHITRTLNIYVTTSCYGFLFNMFRRIYHVNDLQEVDQTNAKRPSYTHARHTHKMIFTVNNLYVYGQ